MTTFKVGDKCRIVSGWDNTDLENSTGTIINVYEDTRIVRGEWSCPNNEEYTLNISFDDIELIERKFKGYAKWIRKTEGTNNDSTGVQHV